MQITETMKFCPKCRRFYDDENLAFCQTDGLPLIKLNQQSELWTEGEKAIEATRETVRKKTRIQKLKRFSKILVATLMTMMVISVVAMNIYIYLPTKENEKAENQTPLPSPLPTDETKIIAETPSPEMSETPQITPSPTVTPDKTPTVSPTPTASKTPTPSPTATIVKEKTPTPVCSFDVRQRESVAIKNSYASVWQSRIEEERSAVINQYKNQNAAVELTVLWEKVDFVFEPDCKTAKALVPYFWTIFPQSPAGRKSVPIELPARQKTFTCRKSGSWKC